MGSEIKAARPEATFSELHSDPQMLDKAARLFLAVDGGRGCISVEDPWPRPASPHPGRVSCPWLSPNA